MLTNKQRFYAIFKAFYFGILPSWFYEKNCHYAENGEGMNINNYKEHLVINLYIIKSLIMKTEHECTHKFHKMKVKSGLDGSIDNYQECGNLGELNVRVR